MGRGAAHSSRRQGGLERRQRLVRPGFSLKRRQLQRRENNGYPVLGSNGTAAAATSGAPKVEDDRMVPADGSILTSRRACRTASPPCLSPVARPSLSLYLSELTRVCALADAAPARCCVEALRTGTLMEDRRFQRHPYTPTLS